jgi:hypothetical protein
MLKAEVQMAEEKVAEKIGPNDQMAEWLKWPKIGWPDFFQSLAGQNQNITWYSRHIIMRHLRKIFVLCSPSENCFSSLIYIKMASNWSSDKTIFSHFTWTQIAISFFFLNFKLAERGFYPLWIERIPLSFGLKWSKRQYKWTRHMFQY